MARTTTTEIKCDHCGNVIPPAEAVTKIVVEASYDHTTAVDLYKATDRCDSCFREILELLQSKGFVYAVRR